MEEQTSFYKIHCSMCQFPKPLFKHVPHTHNLTVRLICYTEHNMVFVLYRWKRDVSGAIMTKEGKPILEFVAIKRKDCGEWAIPGVICSVY